MNYKHAAQQVLDCIGGKDNILSAAHCATRLRLVIADNAKVNKQELENAEGAKGVFEAQGQLQIIFGTGNASHSAGRRGQSPNPSRCTRHRDCGSERSGPAPRGTPSGP